MRHLRRMHALVSGGNGTFEVGAMARTRSRAASTRMPSSSMRPASGHSRAVFRRATRLDAHRLIVVSQELHLARAMYTCRRLGIDADGVVASEFTGDRVLKRERPSAEAEGRSSGGRTGC